MSPSATMSTGKTASRMTTAGVKKDRGSTWKAASSTTRSRTTIAADTPLPMACRRWCPRKAFTAPSTRPRTMWTIPRASTRPRKDISSSSRSKSSGCSPNQCRPRSPKSSPKARPNATEKAAHAPATSDTDRSGVPGRLRRRRTRVITASTSP